MISFSLTPKKVEQLVFFAAGIAILPQHQYTVILTPTPATLPI
jgi:hypothetical protein